MSDPHGTPYLSPDIAGATLTIDLAALQGNYLTMKERAHPAECAAVIKGDGYGTGAVKAAHALSQAGCSTFFVAQLSEAALLRPGLSDAVIYILNGLVPGHASAFTELDVRPVLGNLEEVAEWASHCRDRGVKHAAALHVDTGIARLGLSAADVQSLADNADHFEAFSCTLVMSHLVSADVPGHPMNREQVAAFDALRAHLPAAPASLANSAGTLNGADYRFDMVRTGIALFGGNPVPSNPSPVRPVATLTSSVLQVRDVEEGGTVGYSGTWKASRPSRIAVVPVGYADGYFRWLSRTHAQDGAFVWIADQPAPLAGRVSMDMITVDVTDIAREQVQRGTHVELLGPNISVDDVARWADTIPYEVLTALGSRFARVYSNQVLEKQESLP